MRAIVPSRLNGRQKAAVLIMSLDVDAAAKVFKQLTQPEIELLTIEITNLQGIHSGVVDNVVEEFQSLYQAQGYVLQGGLEYARQILEKSLGLSKASEIVEKVRILTTVRGFDTLKKADSSQLVSFLQKEHPQTIALILSHLSPDQTSQSLQLLPEEVKGDVIFRIATLGKISPNILSEVESVVDAMAESQIMQSGGATGGTKAVASILNRSPNAEAKFLIESIERRDPQLADEIKRLMFLFEDIIYIDDRGIQRILREVDKKDLALAMKVAEEKMKDKIFSNMSERAQALLKEEIQFLGPVRLSEVEAAQTRIVEIVKQLQEREEIVVVGRGGSEEVFV